MDGWMNDEHSAIVGLELLSQDLATSAFGSFLELALLLLLLQPLLLFDHSRTKPSLVGLRRALEPGLLRCSLIPMSTGVSRWCSATLSDVIGGGG